MTSSQADNTAAAAGAEKASVEHESPNATQTVNNSSPMYPGQAAAAANQEPATTGMKVLSFLIPLAGLILFFIDKDKKPAAAKSELIWTGIGLGVGRVLC